MMKSKVWLGCLILLMFLSDQGWGMQCKMSERKPEFRFTANHFVLAAARKTFEQHAQAQSGNLTVEWLHIPKTGTSFFNTLLHYCSPQLPETAVLHSEEFASAFMGNLRESKPQGLEERCRFQNKGHRPYPSGSTVNCNEMWVTMLRDPIQRLRSAYEYHLHSPGFKRERRRILHQTVRNIEQFAMFPGILGCQTRMLSGLMCAEIIQGMLGYAKRELMTNFAFIGITDRWAESICLFHAMYGGQLKPFELANNRPTRNVTAPNTLLAPVTPEQLKQLIDPTDAVLFEVARLWFEEQLTFHHQAVQACLALS